MISYLQDSKGNNSSMRLGYVTWVLGVFLIWAAMCLMKGTLLEIPQTVIEILLVLVTGKTVQTHIETKAPDAKPS